MKAVFILLCLAVAAFAVEVNEDFVKSALELKRHVLESGNLHHTVGKRKMLDLYWSKMMGGRCSRLNDVCHMFQDCCGKMFCDNFLDGKCVREMPY